MGGETTPSHAAVQSAGLGFRLRALTIKHEFGRSGAVMQLLLRYTQALIANLLSVRREGVTESALMLQEAVLIRDARGRITVLDRPGLQRRTCECDAVVKKEVNRLLPVATIA